MLGIIEEGIIVSNYADRDFSDSNGAPSSLPFTSSELALDELASPPIPPEGYEWRKVEDGTFCLEERDNAGVTSTVIIEHIVMPEDTLQGISLRYRATILELRRLNYLSSNSILHMKVLKVPVKTNIPLNLQLNTEEVILQKFRNVTKESQIEAKYYLEEHAYDLKRGIVLKCTVYVGASVTFSDAFISALTAWYGDEQWIRSQAVRSDQTPPTHKTAREERYAREEEGCTESSSLLSHPTLRKRAVRGGGK